MESPTIKEIPAIRVLSIRELGTYDPTIEQLIHRLTSIAFSKENIAAGLKISGPPIYICHDDGYKEKDADIEVAFPIEGKAANLSNSVEKILPAVKAIVLTYKGPYKDIGKAYDILFSYVKKEKLSPSFESREVYLSDPNTVKEEDLLTEIVVPIY